MPNRSLSKITHTKTTIKIILGLIAFLGFFSCGLKPLQAFDPQNFSIDSITVFKVYNAERHLEQRRVLITGQYLKDASVGMITSSGYQEFTDRINNTEGLLQFNINQDQTGNYLVIEGLNIALNEGSMPALSGINHKVRVGVDDLHIVGTNLSAVKFNPGISAGYEHEGAYTPLDKSYFESDSEVHIPRPSGALGLQHLIFQKVETPSCEIRPGLTKTVEVTIKHTYLNQFRFVQDLYIDGLEMYPNRGEAGSKLIFQAPHPQLNTYDVFFLKNIDGTDPYTKANRCLNRTFQSNVNHMDILTVEVPDLPVGEYFVVLTNPVAPDLDPMGQVVQELIVGMPQYQKFTVIDANIKSVILSIQPSAGPDTGSRVTISGQFLGTLNIPEFQPSQNIILTPDPPVNTNELLLSYGPGTYRGTPIKSAQRKLKVIIGDEATFIPRHDGSGYEVSFHHDLDIITVNTAQVADAASAPHKDVVVESETVLTRDDNTTITFYERASLSNGYTYIPSKIEPQIVSITPDTIQVIDAGGHYVVPEDRMASISGSNFALTRFIDNQGQEITRYPILELGPELILDKNSNPELYLRVFDKNGREVDGTEGNELGSRILFMIPANSSLNTLGKNYLKVTNPIKNSQNPGLSAQRHDFISFVNPEANRQPVINEVNPDVVTVDGGETIRITGSNFMNGVTVFLDGLEIKSISRQEDGKAITFLAPPGREGETQLQVMNPGGAMDTASFSYVLTYTNPKISSFAPKMGNTGTLVVVKGKNFLKPEPASGENNPLKLIGTRIMLEGRDINQYNRNPVTNKIELLDYANYDRPLLTIKNGGAGVAYLELADYYPAVLLQADSADKGLFILDKSLNGDITLSNGSDLTFKLEVNPYNQVEAVLPNGSRGLLSLSGSSLEIAGSPALKLHIKTPYQVDSSNNITGKRVEVVDSETLLFTVPVLEAEGYYDLTVINPDTKKDSRVNETGFYYYKMPLSRPEISYIEPDQGSTQGGYCIDIVGRDFEDNGHTKAKVYINGVEINAADTQINSTGDVITVKVPAYPGDLREDKHTDRLAVPVVIVNPDGGSAGLEQGFTYVVPSSHPYITALTPSSGSGAGLRVVEITGSDFRFFEPYDDANRNQIRDPNEAFHDLNHNNRWDSEIDLNDPLTDWREPVAIEHRQYDHYFDSPILPRIYFGQQRARIVEFDRGYLKVLTPTAPAGTVKVYLVNNDSGISNAVNYRYEALNPKITSIIPSQGPKQGGQYVELFGSGFAESAITILQAQGVETWNMPAVRFGSIDNCSIPRDQPNSGRIDNGFASVQLDGGLSLEYRAGETLTVKLQEKGQIFEQVFQYDDSPVYIDMSRLRLQGNENAIYSGSELIKVSVVERRLIVERGYAPQAAMLSSQQLSVKTPSYYTIGTVPVRLYNPDGSQAQTQYEYKNPDSHPQIENITRDGKDPQVITSGGQSCRILKMDYKSQAVVSVLGQDFREGARIQVGDLFSIKPADIRYELPGQLTFVMPVAPKTAIGKLYRVVVINEDGGTAASDQIPGEMSIFIQFTSGESNPSLASVSPSLGPASGGTVVRISGSDLRSSVDGYDDSLQVYFGATKVPDSDVNLLDYKNCRVISTPGSPGAVDVKLENPDGVMASLKSAYTYISEPKVSTVWDSEGNERISELSVLGGEQIRIKGSGFLPGAVVVFSPVLGGADAGNTGPLYRTVTRKVEGLNSRESEAFFLQSGQIVAAQFISPDTLLVTTPAGAIGSSGLLVKNPDGGASDILEIDYDLPQLSPPGEVQAEIIHDSYADCDRYIKIHWAPVSGASQYEIFVLVDGERDYIGSTQLNSFVYQYIKPNRSYQFVVTAVGDFGSSPPSLKSNRVHTGPRAGEPDSDGSPGEKSQVLRRGQQVFFSIGTEDYSPAWFLDLTRGQLAGATEVEVAIPAVVITRNSNSDLRIRGRDFEISIRPAVFNNYQLRAAQGEDAGIRLRIAPAANGMATQNSHLLSTPYSIEAQFYQGLNQSPVDNISGSFALLLSYDQYKAQLRQLRQIMPCRLDIYQGTWVPVEGQDAGGWIVVNSLGTYSIIGKRG